MYKEGYMYIGIYKSILTWEYIIITDQFEYKKCIKWFAGVIVAHGSI